MLDYLFKPIVLLMAAASGLLYWVFRKQFLVMSRWVSRHRVGFAIWSVAIICLLFIEEFFSRFSYDLDAPIENWVNTATYFNNLFSPILLFVTMILLYLTWRDTKKSFALQLADSEYQMYNQALSESVNTLLKTQFYMSYHSRIKDEGHNYQDYVFEKAQDFLVPDKPAYSLITLLSGQDENVSNFILCSKHLAMYLNKSKNNIHIKMLRQNIAAKLEVDLVVFIIIILDFKIRSMEKDKAEGYELAQLKVDRNEFMLIYECYTANPKLTSSLFTDSLLDSYFKGTM
ncbi:hypothetical protein [Pseudoalteromonas sp. T1lg10]|uniref:hypothetical protein n=1 Tax=Pseudoalteromonas sp. T1lg10 TaxID=2077093 RepID=UPI000CF6972D|nr:hypothetical protein [Pseudoalteromonas sp. T1lg10]